MAVEDLLETLADYVLPGAGTIVAQALTIAYDLCGGLEECRDVCLHVNERFGELWTNMKRMEEEGSLPKSQTLPKFSKTLDGFMDFLKKHQKKNILKRLVSNRSIMDEVAQFHQDIDVLFKLLSLDHMAEMSQWRQKNERDWELQQQQMQEMLKNQRTLMAVIGDGDLVESLALIKYEMQYNRDKNKSTQLQMMESTFHKVVRRSKAKVPSVPEWFIPPNDVHLNSTTVQDATVETGSYGNIKRVTWNGADVVIKELLVSDEKSQESFLKEAGSWIKLNHPHVLKLYGACHVTKPPYFVCEEGVSGSFTKVFANGANREMFWKYFVEASAGLLYLETKKMVHGNLKCNNILVAADGKAKISDFGFAFIRSESKALSKKAQSDAVRWKAPECLLGEVDNPGFPSDVFSFGMCIIEAWTGELPWGNDAKEEDIATAAFDGNIPPQPEGMSDHAWKLVQRMCHAVPERRPTLTEISEELHELMETETVTLVSQSDQPCQNCGSIVSLADNFCASCGTKVVTPEQAVQTEQEDNQDVIALGEKIEELSQLCEETQENQLICHHVRSRLETVWKQLKILDEKDDLPENDVVPKSLALAEKFRVFLEELCATQNLVVLLVSQRKVLASLEQFHMEIDGLVGLLNFAEVESWKAQWVDQCNSAEKHLTHRLQSLDHLLDDVPDLEDALSTLTIEIEQCASENSTAHLKLLRLAHHHLVSQQKLLLEPEPDRARRIMVTLVKATDLAAADKWKGTSDPYVIFRVGEEKHQSSMLVRTLNPEWKPAETFEFDVDAGAPLPLDVEVWDHDTWVTHDMIGTVSIPLAPLLALGGTSDPVAYPLKVPSNFEHQKRNSKLFLLIEAI